MEDRLEISVSKTKNIGMIIFGALMLFFGLKSNILGFIYLSKYASYTFLILGVIVLIGGLVAFFLIKGPRLILTKEGLIYNPKTNAFVEWAEIEGVTDFSLNGNHTLLIRLKNVDAFIEKQQDDKIKKNMKRILRVRETPISIDNIMLLELSRSKLLEVLHEYLVKYGN